MTDTGNTAAPIKEEIKEEKDPKPEPVVLATKVCGVVKWFSVKSGYGFINTPSSNEDVFVHSKRIKYNNPRKLYKTLAEGETVEFDIMQGEKGHEAINVTGPDGRYVQGSQFAANKPKYYERRAKSAANKKRKRKNKRNNRKGKKSDSPTENSNTDKEQIKKEEEEKESKSKENTESKDTS